MSSSNPAPISLKPSSKPIASHSKYFDYNYKQQWDLQLSTQVSKMFRFSTNVILLGQKTKSRWPGYEQDSFSANRGRRWSALLLRCY